MKILGNGTLLNSGYFFLYPEYDANCPPPPPNLATSPFELGPTHKKIHMYVFISVEAIANSSKRTDKQINVPTKMTKLKKDNTFRLWHG